MIHLRCRLPWPYLCLLVLLFLSVASRAAPTALYFEPNVGQAAEEVRYIARTGDGLVLLTRDGAVFPFVFGEKDARTTALVRMRFRGASSSGEVRGEDRKSSVSNYYLEDRTSTGVAHFGAVEYAGVYRGIDVRYRGHEGNVEFDFHVAPRADASQIVVAFEHATGLRVDAEGDLLIERDGAIVRQKRPVVYQDIEGVRHLVESRYLLDDDRHEVEFALGAYDREHELVIDPQIVYTTYHGGSDFDSVQTVAAHSNGSAYIAGDTASLLNFPLEEPIMGPGVSSLYISRFDKAGELVYSTFFISPSAQIGKIAVDPSGNLYILGTTTNPNFPRTLQSYDEDDQGIYHEGHSSVFLVKLGPLGGLVYSNFIARYSHPSVLAVDEEGFAYAGLANSGFLGCGKGSNTPGAANYESGICVYKVNQHATNSVYRAVVGGLRHDGHDSPQAAAVDEDLNLYIAGVTGSRDFPTTDGVMRRTSYQRSDDGFVMKLAPNGAMVFSTYFGPQPGSTLRQAVNGIAVAKDKTIYVSGYTNSIYLQTTPPDVVKPMKSGSSTNGFLAQIKADGTGILKATYLGGMGGAMYGGDAFNSMGMDASERIVLGGTAYSPDFPVTTTAHPTIRGQMDCFVMRMSLDFKKLDYSALIGGSGDEECSIAVKEFRVHVAGSTSSPDLPVENARQAAYAGGWDGFLTSYDFEPLPVVFLHGVGGSTLKEGIFTRWLLPYPVLGNWARLSLNPAAPGGLLNATDALRDDAFYGPFIEYLKKRGFREYELHEWDISRLTYNGCDMAQLGQRPNLFVFPYDWRRSIADPTYGGAEQLAEYLKCVRRFYPDKKINIVAHSMGGLVARRMLLSSLEALHVEKVVTMGSPWWGSPKSIATLYNGTFLGPILGLPVASHIKEATRYFPGAHELLPSRTYHDHAAVSAFREESVYGDDLTHAHDYTYDQLVARLDADMPQSTPGSTNRTFHSFQTFSGQDDWASDGSGISFTHFIGVEDINDTIEQVIDRRVTKCKNAADPALGIVCSEVQKFLPIMGRGDGTVPFLSAWRTVATLAPGTSRRLVTGAGRLPKHGKLTSDPIVQQETLDILTSALEPQPSTPLRTPANRFAGGVAGDDDPEIVTSPSVYVTMLGGSAVALSGPEGTSTAVDPLTGYPGEVPGGHMEPLGEDAAMVTVRADADYLVELVSDGEPLLLEIVRGLTNAEPDLAWRYIDTIIPAGVTIEINLPASGMWVVRYDVDDDGIFETVVPPSVTTSGGGALDRTAPEISFTPATSTVTIEALDPSGVARLLYSTDGTHFRLYENPIPLTPPAMLYAFAEDLAGNRSSIYPYDFQPIHASDTVWIDETWPAGSNQGHNGYGIVQWDASKAFTGTQSLVHPNPAEVARQTVIGGLSKPLHIGEKAVAYVYLDPENPPREIMLSWHTDATYHLAYWGEALLGGEVYAVNMGALPPTGEWVRLEVPFAALQVEAQTLHRLDLRHFGGRVWFDRIGKNGTACIATTATQPTPPAGDTVLIDDALPVGGSMGHGGGGTMHFSELQAASGTKSLSNRYFGPDVAFRTYIYGLSMPIHLGESAVFYARINECARPRELKLQWFSNTGAKAVYWGEALLGEENGAIHMGAIPTGTGWLRFEVPFSQLGLEVSTLNRIDISHYGGQVWIDRLGKSGTACIAPTAAQPTPGGDETTFFDDALPAGASFENGWGGPIHWDTGQAASGTKSLTNVYYGPNFKFSSFVTGLSVPIHIGESGIVYVLLDECAPPRELKLNWYTNTGGGSAYWGEALIGEESGARYMGPLPATGQWVRLEVPFADLRLEQSTIWRVQLLHYGGQVWFDRVGKAGTACIPETAAAPEIPAGDTVWVDDALPSGATLVNNIAGPLHWVTSQAAQGTKSLTNLYLGSQQQFSTTISGLSQPIYVGETAVVYARFNECGPPRELKITWKTNLGDVSAYWGEALIGYEGSAVNMGALPSGSGWVRLEVPFGDLIEEQGTLTGVELASYGGQVWYDAIGKKPAAP